MNEDSLSRLDLQLIDSRSGRWDSFYADRAKPCPFFGTAADENLVEWVSAGRVLPGKAIDLGCGNARNAIYLAGRGFSVEGIDYSATAIQWAAERVAQAAVDVSLRQASVFNLSLKPASYDLVYDSGCFHQLAPHRREGYVNLVVNALKPGGVFGLTCFRPEGGSGFTDEEVYQRGSIGGGLGFTEDRLREIWGSAPLTIDILRQMRELPFGASSFGKSFLWVMLARKP